VLEALPRESIKRSGNTIETVLFHRFVSAQRCRVALSEEAVDNAQANKRLASELYYAFRLDFGCGPIAQGSVS